jgi:hypothetical protein
LGGGFRSTVELFVLVRIRQFCVRAQEPVDEFALLFLGITRSRKSKEREGEKGGAHRFNVQN